MSNPLSLFSLSGRGLRLKAVLLVIALDTIPVLVIGELAYHFSNKSLQEQVFATKQVRARDLADKVNRFVFEGSADK